MPTQPLVSDRVRLLLYPGLATPIDSIVALVRGRTILLAVDAGSGLPGPISAVIRGLVEEGWPRKQLKYVVNTHGHVQNSGGDWWFRENARSIIVARDPDALWIETGDPDMTGATDLGVPIRPVIVGLRPARDPFLLYEEPGLRVEIHHTPGHTPGSQSILVEDGGKRVLFIGDALGRLSTRWLSSESEWSRSLEKIRGLEADILCTSAACMEGEASKKFLEEVERAGPEWI